MVERQLPEGVAFASHGSLSYNSPILGNSRSNTPRPSIAGLDATEKDQYYNAEGTDNPDPPAKQATAGSRGPIGEDLIFQKAATWSHKKEQILMGPYDYMINHRGKNIRSQLIAAFNAWLKVPPESLDIITKVVGMLHTASLLVDDVEDSSILRRGVPVAHNIFGTAQTINSANYVYFIALQQLSSLNSTTAIQIYTTELLNLHRGQGMDLFWRETLTCPTENDYLEMVSNKTGGLFRLAIKLMQAESTREPPVPDCVPLVNTIGLLFQILDDYANLSSATYTAHKGLAEDLTEGKFSFPVIHAIRSDPSNLVLLNILRQKTTDVEVKKYAIKYMDEKTGSFAYTRKVLKELTTRALGLVEDMERSDTENDGIAGKAIRNFLEKMRVEEPEGKSEENGVPLSNGPTLSEMTAAGNVAT